MAIANVTLDGTPAETTIFIAGANTAVTVIYIYNSDTVTRTVDVHVKPAGEALAIENQIYGSISIPSGDTYVIDAEKLILDNTDVISAIVGETNTTTAVVATISTIGI